MMEHESLIQKYLLGQVSDEELLQLEQLLRDDPELRQHFVVSSTVDMGLRELAFEQAVESIEPPSRRSRMSPIGFAAAGFALAVVASILVVAFVLPDSSQPKPIAVLLSAENAAWESSLPTTPGSELTSGLLSLKSGVATIRFRSGAEVVMEAPASLELVTTMRGKLLAGAAVIDVPDSAIGFVIETPDGYAIDYGTRFAVRVDHQEQQSDFEIIEGEIAVHHPRTGDEVRLTGQGKTATISDQSLEVIDSELQDDNRSVEPMGRITRIGTNGRAGSALRRNKRKFITPDVLSVKRTDNGKWDYRSFFAFDLSATNLDLAKSARLRLNLVPSTRGLVSRLPTVNRFGVYGLTNTAKANWNTDCLWEESPGPEDGVLLGTFEIPRSQKRGSFGIQNDKLLDFLKANRDGSITLILVRETTQIEGTGPSLTHMFASDSHPEAVGPMLEFTLAE